MFSAWNFHDWVASVGAVLLMFGIVAVLSTLIGYITMAVLGKESEATGETGLSKAKTDMQPGTRRAA